MSTGFDDIGFFAEPSTQTPLVVETATVEQSSPQRRVLHIINGEHYSGAERVQDLLAYRLPEFGYEVAFAAVKHVRFGEQREFVNASLHEITMRSRFDLRAVSQLCRLVDQHGYELIHAHTPRSVVVGKLLASRRQLPLVYHVHSPTSRDSTRSWINRVNSLAERLSLCGAAKLITVSESLRRHMRAQGVPDAQIAVVPNGVTCVEVAAERDLPQHVWTLGTVALFRPRKGTEVLLEALAILRQHGVKVKLRAVGGFETPAYEDTLRRRARELQVEPLVDWAGFQRDVHAQLQMIDLFVLPSLFGEGLPMVVLEAMAAGIPVIGTDVEGVPEAIRDGLEGRIARANDPRDLAAKVASVIQGEYAWTEMRQSALARQRQRFSDRNMSRGVAQVYDEVLAAVV